MKIGDYVRFTKFRGVTFETPLWGVVIRESRDKDDMVVNLLAGPSFELGGMRYTMPNQGWDLHHDHYGGRKGVEYTVYDPDGDLHDFYAVQAMQAMGIELDASN